ncbi:MAG: hypothetical protein QGG64_12420, partial [Candidatus Latescibacteria bacterium]|nr:hypothetical protein [Candidatus Latescibacterota bacterium]
REIDRLAGADLNATFTRVGSFRDNALFAGERLQYRVIAQHSEGSSVRTSAMEIQIPGAGLREIRRDPVGLAVEVVWNTVGADVSGYEVLRTVSGRDAQTVFSTNDVQQTSFWDRSLVDNRSHTYVVRSILTSGVELTSRSLSAQFYRESGRHSVETLRSSEERMRLSSADPLGSSDMLALIGRANQLSLSRIRHTISVNLEGIPRVSRRLVGISFPALSDVTPQSIDLAGPPLTGIPVVFPRAYIGGLDSFGRVFVVGVSLVQNTIVWQLPDNWVSRSDRVRLAHDGEQRVFVATDGQLRVYSSLGFALGAIDLLDGDPIDIAVHDDVIWAVWENRLRKGILQFSTGTLSNIVWEDVTMSGQDQPRALTLNAVGQAFVLAGNRVEAFNADGSPLLAWIVPQGVFTASDVAIGSSGSNLVHLSYNGGEVITYVP